MRLEDFERIHSRRRFFRYCAGGLETIALGHLLSLEGRSASGALPQVNPLAPKPAHFGPKARNVIFLLMAGGPSQIDLYDPKPDLQRWHGKPLPESLTTNLELAFIKPTAKVLGCPRKFKPFGESGIEFSDFLPHTASCGDEICLIRSMYTEAFNHHPGQALLTSGATQLGRPTIGAWVTYGLGSESQNLPAFVVLTSGSGASGGSNNWSSGFLPSTYAGVAFGQKDEPIQYLSNPAGITRKGQRARLNGIRRLNELRYREVGDLAIASRIYSYELAFRMQAAAPDLLDFSDEPAALLEIYGVNKEPTHPYATNCVLARRMVERGVRFVMLVHSSWDDHKEINTRHKKNCDITDRPIGALLKDLKQRGLLDTTLVVWAGEFGRTPMGEVERFEMEPGRDHHPNCFSIWMAGGGIKGGQVVGKTDDFGLDVVEDPVHVHDLQATMLHCLGLEHTHLTYRHMGRDFRLTDVGGHVVKKALA